MAVLFAMQLCSSLWARPTTEHEAGMVVTGWLKIDSQPLGMALGQHVMKVESFSDDYGEPIYYIVFLQPSGFVIVSTDDLVEPIIGFVNGTTYNPSPENPLGALVTKDMNGRMAAVRSTFSPLAITTYRVQTKTQKKWSNFISLAENPRDSLSLMSLRDRDIDDVRVAPLVETKWSQGKVGGHYCYNFFTPNHYPCGCVATAMAQLMRYHRHPETGIGVREFTIYVNDVNEIAYTQGGDGNGGPYIWDDMVFEPNYLTPVMQRRAIGKLCSDAGIAVGMSYTSEASAAYLSNARDELLNTFQYKNAIYVYNGNIFDPFFPDIGPGLNSMLNPNLDARRPVILSLCEEAPDEGHVVLVDGYGYNTSTLYHHLNFGWAGKCDLWYNLPDVSCSGEEPYNFVRSCIYNISISSSGEIVSGRVLHADGRPADANVVCLEHEGKVISTCETNSNGIFSFVDVNSNTSYTLYVEDRDFPSQQVKTGTSEDGHVVSGNVWGVYFHPDPPRLYVDDDAANDPAPRDPSVSDPVEDGSAEHPFDTIQEAIDATMPGEIAIVLQGTYTGDGNRDLDFKGKPITLRSEDPDDPNVVANTIIDCQGSPDAFHRGFEFRSGEKATSALKGLTITGGFRGSYSEGGGIYCRNNSSPTIASCMFSGNTADNGGGIYTNNSSPILINCTFTNNSGGGMRNSYSSPTLTNCIFTNNSDGGMFNLESSPTLTNCTFTGNSDAGMTNDWYSSPILTNCTFTGNRAAMYGGGMNNAFESNPTLTNCTFNGNSAENWGGGMFNVDSSPVLTNCTFSANRSRLGGGIYNLLAATSILTNCILWDNTNQQISGDNTGAGAVVSYSNIQGDWPGDGNIDSDPLFTNPGFWDTRGTPEDPNDDFWVDGDYHLKSHTGRWDPISQSWVVDDVTSPCIDAGDPDTLVDLELLPNGGIINMGTYGGTLEASKSP